MKKLTYAIIGFGGIAENRIAKEGFARDRKRFRPLQHAVLVGASDVSPSRRSAAEALGLKWYDSAEAVCADTTIGAVYIATNNLSHYPLAKMAIEAGKHVILEKPLTTSLQDARELVALAAQKNVSLAVDHMMVHNAWNIKAKQMVRRGELGKVEAIVLHMEFPYGFTPAEAATWRCADPEEVGGPVGDVASHCLYMAEFLLGETITSVQGVYTPPVIDIRAENGAYIKCTADKGTAGTIRVSFSELRGSPAATLLNLGYEIYGARKTLRACGTLFQLSGHPGEPIPLRLELDDGRTVKKVKPGKIQNIYRTLVEHHAKSASGGARSTGEDAVHNLDLVVNVHRSAQANGRPIQIGVRKETEKMATEETKKNVSGGETEGGITSSYATNDGVTLKVPYAFMGSIYDEAEEKAAIEAMHQDSLTMGPKTTQFQNEFAKLCGVKHARAVTNCTTGMHVATQVFDIREGDEVIVTPITFIATSLVVLKEKARPVYADIDPRTFNIDPKSVEAKVTKKTKAIYVVHYGGQVVDMDPIMEIARKHNLLVMEDCAHAVNAEYKGRKAGSLADIGVFSFHSLKNITTCGEGGMITTNNDEYAKAVDSLRCMNLKDWDPKQLEWKFGDIVMKKEKTNDYWIPSHFDVEPWNGHWGNNYRMNEIQAAVGVAQLKKVEMLTDKRREIGQKITAGLQGIRGVTPVYVAPYAKHVYHLYTLCIEEEELGAGRDEFLRTLYNEEGIQGILHYQPTFHLAGLRKMGYDPCQCPNATKFFYKRELNLPMHPRLTDKDIQMMVEGIRNAAKKVSERAAAKRIGARPVTV